MRKLPKTLVEKIIDNTYYDTRKYSYFYEKLLIKRIKKVDLNTTAVYDEDRWDLYDMHGNPIDRNLLEKSYMGCVSNAIIERIYPKGEYKGGWRIMTLKELLAVDREIRLATNVYLIEGDEILKCTKQEIPAKYKNMRVKAFMETVIVLYPE